MIARINFLERQKGWNLYYKEKINSEQDKHVIKY